MASRRQRYDFHTINGALSSRAARGSLRHHPGRGHATPKGERPNVWSERWRILSTVRDSIPLSGRVVEGYAVLQPRVTPSLPKNSEGSLFQRVFTIPSGLDPTPSRSLMFTRICSGKAPTAARASMTWTCSRQRSTKDPGEHSPQSRFA